MWGLRPESGQWDHLELTGSQRFPSFFQTEGRGYRVGGAGSLVLTHCWTWGGGHCREVGQFFWALLGLLAGKEKMGVAPGK